ncbi:hypothetical protein BJY00DRAFT_11944 [Aspergillus carlsbadensis]|nr:hypothetical protein BJY00DRAFT_11944 [Aspergillus carlsbadensis]
MHLRYDTFSPSIRFDTISFTREILSSQKKKHRDPAGFSWSLELRRHDNHESLSFPALLMPPFFFFLCRAPFSLPILIHFVSLHISGFGHFTGRL